MSDSMLSQRLAAYRAAHPPRRVTTTAGTFEYTVGGAGDRTVVLLHGGGSVAEAAHPFALALEPALRVIAIDWPASVRTVDDVLRGILEVLTEQPISGIDPQNGTAAPPEASPDRSRGLWGLGGMLLLF